MSVIFGDAGAIELTRSSVDRAFTSVVNPSDVNAAKDHFSFDFQAGMLLTGDQLEIKATDGKLLDFVDGWSYPDGKWFINVDQVGSIRLYQDFGDALAGEKQGRAGLSVPSRDIPIEVRVRNALPRMLGRVTNFELNTSREAVDVTELGEEFREQHATLISGSGQLNCFFDYKHERCGGLIFDGFEPELPIYLHQLLLRQQLGSGFHARLFVLTRGSGHDSDDEVWYEFDGLITNAGIAFEPTQPVRSTIQFVTTGEVKLLVKTTGKLLMQEDSGYIRLERSQGAGFIELEQAEE